MSKKTILFVMLPVLSVLIFSFKTPRSNFRIDETFKARLMSDTGGRRVRLDSAQACIDRFAIEMKKHGFSNQEGEKVNIHIKRTSKITTGEVFNGKQLQEWLNATAADYAASGKTLMIKIQLGIYDMAYLNTYQPNAALRQANNNRIAIFIVPYDSASAGFNAISAQPQGSGGTGGGGGGTGYDLGGVQP